MEDDLEDMEAVLNLSLQKVGYSKLRDGQKRVVDLVRTHGREATMLAIIYARSTWSKSNFWHNHLLLEFCRASKVSPCIYNAPHLQVKV